MVSSTGLAQTQDQPIVTETHIITPHDTIPRFCADPTVVARVSGPWSDPNTWSTGQVPRSDSRVSIPQNRHVTYNVHSDAEIDCIEIAEQGELAWATNQDTRLRVTTLQVLPHGALTIGASGNPVSANHMAELIIRDVPLDVHGKRPQPSTATGLTCSGQSPCTVRQWIAPMSALPASLISVSPPCN